jgi:predicted helicase
MYSRFYRWASDRIAENGVVAFITNRNFLDAREADGFRDVVAREFNEIHIVDLGADVRANPKLSGTRHNVFGIQTGVAIGFLVKRAKAQGCRIFYSRRPEFETAEEKLAWLSKARLNGIERSEIRPDTKHNWLNLTDNDFDTLMPVASKVAKAAKKPAQEKAIFKLFSIGVSTNRDEWVIAESPSDLTAKMQFFAAHYAEHPEDHGAAKPVIKWSRNLKRRLARGNPEPFDSARIRRIDYRPYHREYLYDSELFVDERGMADKVFFDGNISIAICGVGSAKPFQVLANDNAFGVDYLEKTQALPLHVAGAGDNITDWALKQFRAQYPLRKQASIGRGEPEKFPHPDRKDRYLPLRVRPAARSGVPRKVRAESEARIPAHSLLRGFLALGRLGQDADGFAHRL